MKNVDVETMIGYLVLLCTAAALAYGAIAFLIHANYYHPSKVAAAKAAHLHHCRRSGGNTALQFGKEFGKAGLKVEPITVKVRDGWNITIGAAEWEFTPTGAQMVRCETSLYDWKR